MNLVVGRWYLDPETEHSFLLVSVEEKRVHVLDAWGEARILNRILWENDMVPTNRSSGIQKQKSRRPMKG
jgi:hypothetical protein